MECARPAVVEGEGLGEGLADDVACFVWVEEFGVKRNDFDGERSEERRVGKEC